MKFDKDQFTVTQKRQHFFFTFYYETGLSLLVSTIDVWIYLFIQKICKFYIIKKYLRSWYNLYASKRVTISKNGWFHLIYPGFPFPLLARLETS